MICKFCQMFFGKKIVAYFLRVFLMNFLSCISDVPRSRLVKYPLLLKQVLKFSNATNEYAADMHNLNSAIEELETIIRDVDVHMAEARAQFTVSRLEWLDEAVEAKVSLVVSSAKEEIISGTLRNNRGTKLECYLLDTVLILGRPSSRLSVVMSSSTTSLASTNSSTSSLCSLTSNASNPSSSIRPATKRLQVYRTPIPTHQLVIEDLNAQQNISGSFTESKQGSFKKSFNSVGKNGFRVSFKNPQDGQSHTLFAPDEHSKKQWLAALKKVTMNEISTVDSSISTPKRIYAPKGKVLKPGTPASRVNLFAKNRRNSPRIKASLSHTALESVKSGGAVKKIRSINSAKKLVLEQETVVKLSKSTSKLPAMKLELSNSPPPTPPPRGLKRENSKGSLVAAAVGRRILRQQLHNSRASPSLKLSRSRLPPPVPPKSSNVRKLAGPRLRTRTKSWGSLHVSILLISDSNPSFDFRIYS